MKRVLFILLTLLFFAFLNAEEPSTWSCSSDADCSTGMVCPKEEKICRMENNKFAKYAVITLSLGANNPNSRGSDRIFIEHPAQDLVIGQLAVNASSGSEEGKYYLIKRLLIDLSVYPTTIKFGDFKLVYDKNGDALFDPSETVVSEGVVSGYSVTFDFNQKYASYETNSTSNFLIVGSFSSDKEIDSIWKFNAVIKDKTYITTKVDSPEVSVAETEPIYFPSFSFEPTKGYFLFASGPHFPKAPAWTEMNREQEIMQLRIKALDGPNEVKSINLRLDGTSVSFGNGVNKVSLYIDTNNDGIGDILITENSSFEIPSQTALLQVPDSPDGTLGPLALSEGEEKFLVIKADLNFYSEQVTKFMIKESDILLASKQSIAGVTSGNTIQTEQFKYANCSKIEDKPCNPAPSDEKASGDNSGCSLLFID